MKKKTKKINKTKQKNSKKIRENLKKRYKKLKMQTKKTKTKNIRSSMISQILSDKEIKMRKRKPKISKNKLH